MGHVVRRRKRGRKVRAATPLPRARSKKRRRRRTGLPSTARRNIKTIARVERELRRNRSAVERAGDGVCRFFGSILFIVAHGLFFAAWFLVNTGRCRQIVPFDPYPFPFLSLVLGIEFIFLTTFVLMAQNHQMQRSEQWAHLHLQLSMLTEHEVKKGLRMLGAVCRRMRLQRGARDRELTELTQPTSVAAFVGAIERSREAGGEAAALFAALGDVERQRGAGPEQAAGG